MSMQHNIFISYAWVDNEIYPSTDKGWVSTFVDGLRKHLAREMGRRDESERIWLDYEQMRGNQGVTSTIRAQLESSRTLVLILSNGYLASPWCRQELETFVERIGTDSGRIFVVQMSPVDEEPEALRDLVKYRFWYRDEKNQPCTRWFPYIDPTDREYSPEQQRLARDLAAKLRELVRSETPPRNVQPKPSLTRERARVEQTAPTPQPRATSPPQAVICRFVLVNGGVEDSELICAVAKRLEQHQLGVAVPLAVLPDRSGIRSSALTRDLRTKLSLCDSVLMIYRRGPLDQVSQYLIECLKASAKAPKGKTPPSIDLCQTHSDPLALGLRPPGMRIRVVDEACADDCVEWFLAGISS
jgi:hypothetical protein